MKSTKAASRYAKALLELAVENGKLDMVADNMRYLAKVSSENHDFRLLLNSPIVKADKKVAIFNDLFSDFDKVTTLFIGLITKNRREYMLNDIAQAFENQVKAYKGIVPVTLVSAVPLNAATRENIMKKIKSSVKGELEVNEIIDKSLIGGFIVRMDDKQIDASVLSQFNKLKQRLTK
ncbi:MAG: ATP synthase F1 subunit delta [Bacteroidota bacterium]|jgi:F-type H+-transporting ATPase subunit delta